MKRLGSMGPVRGSKRGSRGVSVGASMTVRCRETACLEERAWGACLEGRGGWEGGRGW